jgi:hypothetical protein
MAVAFKLVCPGFLLKEETPVILGGYESEWGTPFWQGWGNLALLLVG